MVTGRNNRETTMFYGLALCLDEEHYDDFDIQKFAETYIFHYYRTRQIATEWEFPRVIRICKRPKIERKDEFCYVIDEHTRCVNGGDKCKDILKARPIEVRQENMQFTSVFVFKTLSAKYVRVDAPQKNELLSKTEAIFKRDEDATEMWKPFSDIFCGMSNNVCVTEDQSIGNLNKF